MKAVGYIRVSSAGQVADGESLERQEEKIRAYATLKGITDLQIIADRGISGSKSNRPGFLKLKELAESKAVDVIIVYDLSRLSRSVEDTIVFINRLQKYDVDFVSLSNDIDTTTPMGKAMLTIVAAFNQLYRDEVSAKMSRMIAYKKEKNEKTGGYVPYGFAVDAAKKLIPLDYEQKVLGEIKMLRSKGVSYRGIAAKLQSKKILTKTGNTSWHPQVVKEIYERKGN